MTPRRHKHPVKTRRTPDVTRVRLIAAAQTLFNTKGFDGTDSNRIAAAAGFAPQTFYRHFPDKTAIFLAVYEQWWRTEADALRKILSRRPQGAPRAAARAVLAFHTDWRVFRRSLRSLTVSDPRVRQARAAARRAQLEELSPGRGRAITALVGTLLTAERLCDAAADGELADLGLTKPAILKLITEALIPLLAQAGPKRL